MKKEINDIQLMSVEARAEQKKKEVSCLPLSIIFLICLGIGIYYWFVDEVIFDYYSILPFWGFVCFTAIGIVLDIIISWIYSIYWSDYNKIIEEANKEIEKIIKYGNCNEGTLFRLKKNFIERKIGKEDLTDEEFYWHSSKYCWGCGKRHTVPGQPYTVHRKRTVTWKEKGCWYTKTYHASGTICLCPSCYARLRTSDRISDNNDDIRSKIMIGLYVIIVIGVFLYVFITQINGNGTPMSGLGYGLLSAFLALGFSRWLGQIILMPLAAIIAIPFTKKNGDVSTKWTFEAIPEIRRFMKRDLPRKR